MSPQDLVAVTPSIVMVNQSESAQFMCTSGGGPGNTFQWYHNGQILSGENSTVLNITMVTASDAGEYNCTVSNEAGSDGDVSTLIGEEGVSVQVVMCPRRLVRGVGGCKW